MKYVSASIQKLKRKSTQSKFAVRIPVYHRSAIGLFPGTKIYITPLKNRRDVMITTINPENWGDIWRIEVGLHDRPGAVKSIIDTLTRNKVSILLQESLSDVSYKGMKNHTLYLLVDLAEYVDDIDGDTDSRNHVYKPNYRPNNLINQLISNSKTFLHTSIGEHRWDLYVERLEAFYRNKESRTNSFEANIFQNEILLPQKLILDTYFQGKKSITPSCHITSDTEEQFLKIHFLEENEQYLLFEIDYQEKIGSILDFSRVIQEFDANIINSYSRMFNMNERALWYTFIHIPKGVDEKSFKNIIARICSIDSVRALTLKGSHGLTFSPTNTMNEFEDPKFNVSTPAKKRTSTKLINTAPDFPGAIESARLNLQPFYFQRNWESKPNTVYVAMSFENLYEDFYHDKIHATIASNNLQPIRIDKSNQPETSAPISDAIKKAIAECKFVVADMSSVKPNVLYQIGLAHAIGKKVLIICEDKPGENIKSSKSLGFDLYPDLFYSIYKPQKFLELFDSKIKSMIKDRLEQQP